MSFASGEEPGDAERSRVVTEAALARGGSGPGGQDPAAFSRIAESLRSLRFLERASSALGGIDLAVLVRWLDFAIEEARHALNFLSRYDLTDRRMLEVGAGLGLTSFILRQRGLDVVSLEPGESGFEAYAVLANLTWDHLGLPAQPLLNIPIEELDPAVHGHFDVVFSNNVIEHVRDVGTCLTAMHAVLAPGGLMVHNCPNYAVPFEPHYRIPLVPVFPAATRWFLPRRVAQEKLWRSINFITYRSVRACARHHDCEVRFADGVMYEAFLRLETDPAFARRQQGIVTGLYGFLRRTRLLGLLRRWPYQICTPMIFEWRRRGHGRSVGRSRETLRGGEGTA